MVYSIDKNPPLFRQPLSLPPPLPGYDLPLQLPPSGPVSSPQPLSTRKVEVVSKSWADQAGELVQQSRSGCSSTQLAAFEDLIKKNQGEINKRLEADGTIFHVLAKWGAPLEFVAILARYGADFGAQDVYSNTPFMWAIANGNNGMAREILKQMPASQRKSLDKQSKLYQNNSALHMLIAKGYITANAQGKPVACSNFELLQRAVALGAEVNIPDSNGNTPLHLAYLRRDAQMVKFLLASGADRRHFNNSGQIPMQMAKSGSEGESYASARAIVQESAGGKFFLFSEESYKNRENFLALMALK